jgi:hypothetical protein
MPRNPSKAVAPVAVAAPVDPDELVHLRVTEFGDGKLSTGKHISGLGDEVFEKDDLLTVTADLAVSLRAKGYCEIAKGKPPKVVEAPVVAPPAPPADDKA